MQISGQDMPEASAFILGGRDLRVEARSVREIPADDRMTCIVVLDGLLGAIESEFA